ncbi:hypothetical protein A0J61_04603 [Choanephora cucurbitarum]|uniref:F-box domain-containing protein n=1 Tax=Choanephora cucurbitarum TaxID=101091 RepID=A0A1C7NE45_9FUNG|nr:hypothetical protein A0J61_04603 [Choanephora cucurbitarum]
MASILSLPTETLFQIFGYLWKGDKISCMLVCKRFYPIALKNCFSQVRVDVHSKEYVIPKNAEQRKRCQLLAPDIDCLTISNKDFACDEHYTAEELMEVFSLYKYAEYIYVRSLTDVHTLCRVPKVGALKHMKTIGFCCSLEEPFDTRYTMKRPCYSAQMELMYHFRNSLISAIIIYFDMPPTLPKQPIHSYLADFDRLTRLSFQDEHTSPVTLFGILHACPHLESIEYISYKDQCPETLQLAEAELGELKAKQPKPEANRPTSIYPGLRLKSISLMVSTFPPIYIRFLNDYIRPGVERCELTLLRGDLFTWIASVGESSVLHLMNHMSNVPHASLIARPEDDDNDFLLEIPLPEWDIDTFFRLAHALKGNREVVVEFTLSDGCDLETSLSVSSNYQMILEFPVDLDVTPFYENDILEGIWPENYNPWLMDQEDLEPWDEDERHTDYMDRIYRRFLEPEHPGFGMIHEFNWYTSRNVFAIPTSLVMHVISKCPELRKMKLENHQSLSIVVKEGSWPNSPSKQDMLDLPTLRTGRPEVYIAGRSKYTTEHLYLITKFFPNIKKISLSDAFHALCREPPETPFSNSTFVVNSKALEEFEAELCVRKVGVGAKDIPNLEEQEGVDHTAVVLLHDHETIGRFTVHHERNADGKMVPKATEHDMSEEDFYSAFSDHAVNPGAMSYTILYFEHLPKSIKLQYCWEPVITWSKEKSISLA